MGAQSQLRYQEPLGTLGTGTGELGHVGSLRTPRDLGEQIQPGHTQPEGFVTTQGWLTAHVPHFLMKMHLKAKRGELISAESLSGAHPAAKSSSPSLPPPKQLPGDQDRCITPMRMQPGLRLPSCCAVMLWGTRQEVLAPWPEGTCEFNPHPSAVPVPASPAPGKDQHRFSIIDTQARKGPAEQKHPETARPGGH